MVIPTNSNVLPSSFSDFIQRLEHCDPTTLGYLGVPGLKNGSSSSLNVFLKSILYSVQSFSDLNIENTFRFLKRIHEIFPNDKRDVEDKKCLNVFLTILQEKGNPKKEIPVEKITIDMMLKSAHFLMSLSPSDRWKQIVERALLETPEQKLFHLQMFLNLLIAEEHHHEALGPWVHAALKGIDLQDKQSAMVEKVIHVDAFTYSASVSIEKIETAEEYAFFYQIANYVNYKEKDGSIFVTPKRLSFNEMKGAVQKLKQMLPIAKHSRSMATKLLTFLECELSYLENKNKLQIFFKWVNKYKNSLVGKAVLNINPLLEARIFPSFNYTHAIFHEQLNSVAKSLQADIPLELNREEFESYKRLIEFWHSTRKQQQEFYQFLLGELNQLGTKVEKRKFLSYKKDLLFALPGETAQGLPDKLPLIPLSQDLKELLKIPPEVIPPKKEKLKKTAVIAPTKPKKRKETVQKNPEKEEVISEEPIPEPEIESFKDLSPEQVPFRKTFPYQYSDRVQRWLNLPIGATLSSDQFPEYADRSLEKQRLAHAFHAFSPLVDDFLSLAIQGKWTNNKGQESHGCVFVAQISFEGKKYRGIISYGIDGHCYHRCFSERTDYYTLNKKVEQKLNESDFPDWTFTNSAPSKYIRTEIKNTKVSINREFGYITIKDSRMTVKLFVDF